MNTRFVIGKNRKTFHLPGCPVGNRGKMYPWARVDNLSNSGVEAVANAQGIKACTVCKPLARATEE